MAWPAYLHNTVLVLHDSAQLLISRPQSWRQLSRFPVLATLSSQDEDQADMHAMFDNVTKMLEPTSQCWKRFHTLKFRWFNKLFPPGIRTIVQKIFKILWFVAIDWTSSTWLLRLVCVRHGEADHNLNDRSGCAPARWTEERTFTYVHPYSVRDSDLQTLLCELVS